MKYHRLAAVLLLGSAVSCFAQDIGSVELVVQSMINEGIALASAGDYDGALRKFTRSVELSPSNSKAYFNRGIVYLRQNKRQVAIVDFKKACGLGNKEGCSVAAKFDEQDEEMHDRAASLLKKATKAANRGDNDVAQKYLDQAIMKVPDYAPAYYLKAHIYYNNMKDYPSALLNVQKAVALRPGHADSHFLLALIYRDTNKTKDSLDEFGKAIEMDKLNPIIYDERGDLFYKDKKTDQAYGDYTEALALDKKDKRALLGIGTLLKEQGEYEKALIYLNNACGLASKPACDMIDEMKKTVFPDDFVDVSDYLGKAAAARSKGKFREALKYTDKAITKYPKSVEAQMMRGDIYLTDIKDYENAATSFGRAIELNPDSLKAYQLRARAHHELSMQEEELLDLQNISRLGGGDFDTFNRIAQIAFENKKYDEAIKQYRKAEAINGKDGEMLFGFANAYRKKGDSAGWEKYVRKSCSAGFKTACDVQQTFAELKKAEDKKAAKDAKAGKKVKNKKGKKEKVLNPVRYRSANSKSDGDED